MLYPVAAIVLILIVIIVIPLYIRKKSVRVMRDEKIFCPFCGKETDAAWPCPHCGRLIGNGSGEL